MANILFYDNMFSLAGTTKAVLDYADANEKYLGNKSFLAFNKKIDSSFESHLSESVFKKTIDDAFDVIKDRYPTILGKSSSELEEFIIKNNIDYFYQIKSGEPNGFLSKKAKNLIHAVFPQHPNNKHGDKYAFVSSWLSEHCSSNQIPFIPHIINKPNFDLCELKKEFREQNEIPLDAKVFGRIGSYNEFNIEFVQETIKKIVNENNNIYFIFCNTKAFYEHPRISYFYPVYEEKEKYSFIAACDAMIHARKRGETFGLSVAEFSSCNKPVLTWSESNEKAHLDMLGNNAITYKDKDELIDLLLNYKIDNCLNYNSYDFYNSENVIKIFNDVFLK